MQLELIKNHFVSSCFLFRYEHKFVFRGFSEEEFNERSIEVVVGGVASAHGRHLVVGGLRMSDGVRKYKFAVIFSNPKSNGNKEFTRISTENYIRQSKIRKLPKDQHLKNYNILKKFYRFELWIF